MKKGVGPGIGLGSGSISQRYGSGDPDMSRIPNTAKKIKYSGVRPTGKDERDV
jgi:hypothetical protein